MLSSDLRDTTRAFVDRQIPAAQLEEWLVPRLQRYLQNPDATDADVAATIELGLVEFGQGRETEDDLRRTLLDVLRTEQAQTIITYMGQTFAFTAMTSTSQTQSTVTQVRLPEPA